MAKTLMDIYREEEEEEARDSQESVKETAIHDEKKYKMIWNWRTYLACIWSFLVCLAGGAILVFWVIKHHPANTQLWMVPVGLILFSTPIFIWFTFLVSDLCCPKEDGRDVLQPVSQV